MTNYSFSYLILTGFLISIFLMACNEDIVFSPKPRAYPKVEYPTKGKYIGFDKSYCGFNFQYPDYATIEQDTLFFDEKPADDCWFDIIVPSLNARIHCSYYPLGGANTFEKLNNDAFVLANKHTVKAEYIDQMPVHKPNDVDGYVFDIEGPVASPLQFYLTDSTSHFLRGALYVNAKVQPDSLAPIYDFLKHDVMHLINTFEWE